MAHLARLFDLALAHFIMKQTRRSKREPDATCFDFCSWRLYFLDFMFLHFYIWLCTAKYHAVPVFTPWLFAHASTSEEKQGKQKKRAVVARRKLAIHK